MKVYVGTYNKYNCGSIGGKWLNLADYKNASEFYAKCGELHKNESDPEFMFQDSEDVPESLIGESFIDDRVFDILNLNLNPEEQTAFIEFLDSQSFYWEDIGLGYDSFQELFMGNFDKLQDYTDQEFDDLYLHEIPEHLIYVIDYDAYYHTAKYDYWISKTGNVFHN